MPGLRWPWVTAPACWPRRARPRTPLPTTSWPCVAGNRPPCSTGPWPPWGVWEPLCLRGVGWWSNRTSAGTWGRSAPPTPTPPWWARIVEHCLQAGAREVSVFDHTCDAWARSYRNSGIERAVKDAGGKVVSGASEGYYQKVDVPGARRLMDVKVHELVLGADVFINVPVLKHHSSTGLTIGMKNLMGTVWDRGYWHRNDLHQCIADFIALRRPALTVVDAFDVMKQNGPRGVSVDDVSPDRRPGRVRGPGGGGRRRGPCSSAWPPPTSATSASPRKWAGAAWTWTACPSTASGCSHAASAQGVAGGRFRGLFRRGGRPVSGFRRADRASGPQRALPAVRAVGPAVCPRGRPRGHGLSGGAGRYRAFRARVLLVCLPSGDASGRGLPRGPGGRADGMATDMFGPGRSSGTPSWEPRCSCSSRAVL